MSFMKFWLIPSATNIKIGREGATCILLSMQQLKYQSSKAILKKPGVRYVLVGGSAYVLELFVIILARNSGASNIWAVALSFCIGLMYSFILQKFITFSDRRTQHKVLLSQLLTVSALVVFNFMFTIIVTALLQHIFPAIITRTIAIGITTIWNFYLYKAHIFTNPVVD